MKMMKISMAAAAACLLTTSAYALKTEDRVLKDNYQVEYTKAPGDVNSFTEMFTKGEVYGRLRSNMFWYDWENEDLTNSDIYKRTHDNNQWGLGGSLVYKTGFFKGFGATVGFYGTVPMVGENTVSNTTNTLTANYGKSGKDTYRTRPDGTEASIGVFAEAYGEYKHGKTDVKIGRQGIDSIMLATNDTKMIPNTFEAAVMENKDLPNTTLRAGYIMSQKLRDHQEFHSILAYDQGDTSVAVKGDKVYENDDSGVHKGLSVYNIRQAGGDVDPEMLLLTASNKSISNLKLDAEYVGISGFFNTLVTEGNYKIKVNDAWTLTPGVRYLRQMDDGAGAIGGAALSGNVVAFNSSGLPDAAKRANARANYTNPDSVDGSIIMARLVAENGPLALQVGYSKVANDADIIAPWRGFPTGGYTRSMAQVDWIANTKSWAVKATYDFGKAGIIEGFKVAADYENMNFDEGKAYSSGFSDRDIFHVDMWKTFKEIPNTEFKFRFATVNADNLYTGTSPVLGTQATTDYASYDEYRFEINYLF
ncbi:OprD family outer membrane porin [Sulfuricurvum sp.]|uniref:OprD family outer membrane porin n=1 Tax=Sulfuricurvum sp. TaxID=2025608 RepID=UPI002635D833|nr:OprD family outer membrane porin [Sulfuricurvum sp.]MDD2265389.1 OprD family outer membrane porin [Sulfuricurvum sp.]MDD2784467.1 OprD family outer membrane porin [Sulfuricurvum sp.]